MGWRWELASSLSLPPLDRMWRDCLIRGLDLELRKKFTCEGQFK